VLFPCRLLVSGLFTLHVFTSFCIEHVRFTIPHLGAWTFTAYGRASERPAGGQPGACLLQLLGRFLCKIGDDVRAGPFIDVNASIMISFLSRRPIRAAASIWRTHRSRCRWPRASGIPSSPDTRCPGNRARLTITMSAPSSISSAISRMPHWNCSNPLWVSCPMRQRRLRASLKKGS